MSLNIILLRRYLSVLSFPRRRESIKATSSENVNVLNADENNMVKYSRSLFLHSHFRVNDNLNEDDLMSPQIDSRLRGNDKTNLNDISGGSIFLKRLSLIGITLGLHGG